jgi:uncharacterized DUF497 family protein
MTMNFIWDEIKNGHNVKKHGIAFEDVANRHEQSIYTEEIGN